MAYWRIALVSVKFDATDVKRAKPNNVFKSDFMVDVSLVSPRRHRHKLLRKNPPKASNDGDEKE